MSANIWKLDYYEKNLENFLENGYSVGTFLEYIDAKPEKMLVLRHDIDFDPYLLRKMIAVENRLGIHSSNFFRVCSRNYNVLSVPVLEILHELDSSNHEIGLHLDCETYQAFETDPLKFANLQRDILNCISPQEIRGFSLHYPAVNDSYTFADSLVSVWNLKYHAYNNLFFKKFKYLSDSGGRWRESHFGKYLNHANLLQVLLHPIWHYDKVIQENF